MRFKNKGRKIYKTKEKRYYRKGKSGRFMSIALTVLLTGGLVFVGYSVAGPLLNYTKKKGDNSISSLGSSTNYSETSEDSGDSLETLENIQTVYKCTFLSRSCLEDIDSLEYEIGEIVETDAEYIVVPLKLSGGKIYYSSDVRGAGYSGAVVSYLELYEIVSAIEEAGLKSIAYMSVLDDNIYPASYPDAGYRIEESGSVWIDDNPYDGGKPWLNPFSYDAVEYSESLADEITLAGFDEIIFSDIVFPPFRESDIEYIGETVRDSGRYTSLVSLANDLYDIAEKNGVPSMLEVSAEDIAKGCAEVFRPGLLSTVMLVVNIDFDNLYTLETTEGKTYHFTGDTASKAKKLMRIIKEDIKDFKVIIRLSGENLYEEDLEETKSELIKLGYESYIY
ncbi:MAG: putative glycoside hydrolase [Oscillospiraceae bacterium]|nr:putative glycoside hydrolase [Oscillospiraceae bacterium]